MLLISGMTVEAAPHLVVAARSFLVQKLGSQLVKQLCHLGRIALQPRHRYSHT